MVNTELQNKVETLSQIYDDMTNLLNSLEIATIFLDTSLHIKRFTPQAREICNLIQSDVGRPISDIVTNLQYASLIQDAQEVLRTLVFRELEVQAQTGTWYLMRMRPYRTAQNIIDGLIITFVDITRLKDAEAATHTAEAARTYAEGIVEAVREPLVILDTELRVVSANQAFYRSFHVIPPETEGQLLYTLGNSQWDIPLLRQLLTEVLLHHTTFQDFKVEHDFPNIGHKVMLLNARRIERLPGKPSLILLAIEDVTTQQRQEGT
jgi:PAS domain-containing protein